MANQYSEVGIYDNLKYSPESFRDMSVVPIALRDRHDRALQAQDDLLLQLNNIQVQPEFQGYYDEQRKIISEKVNTLTNKINSIGAGNSDLMGEFRNMKRDYNKEVSLSGGIGKAANIKKNIDTSRANYMKFGVEQGWTPKTAQENFENYYKDYMGNIDPNAIGQSGTVIQDFNPTFAPKQIDPTSLLKEVQPLIGKLSEDEAWQSYAPVSQIDANGNTQISYIQTGGKKLSESNLPNLKAVENFINQKLLDPNSDLRQSLKYARPGVSDEEIIDQFVKESDFLLEAMKVQSTSKATQVGTPNFPTPKTGSGSDEEAPASLVSTPTGQDTFEGKSYTDIVNGNRIKELEAKENSQTGITEKEASEKKLAILQKYRIEQELANPDNVKEINSYLQKNGSLKNKSIEGYKEEINKIEKLAKQKELQIIEDFRKRGFTEQDFNALGGNPLGEAKAIQGQANSLKQELDEAMQKSINLDDLAYSKMYSIGPGKEGAKANDTFIKNANQYGASNLATLARNSGGVILRDSMTQEDVSNLEQGDLQKEFATGQVNFKSVDILDTGGSGTPQLIFNYEKGTGDKLTTGKIAINYSNDSTDTSVIDSWLVAYKDVLDPKGQAVIQSIIDNKTLSAISVDNQEFATKGISKSQSKKIKELSNLTTEKKYSKLPEYKQANYIERIGDRDLNIVLDKKGYHSLYIGQGKAKGAIPGALNAGDWIKRDLIMGYADNHFKSANPIESTDPQDKRKLVMQFKDFAENFAVEDGTIAVDNNSKRYLDIKQGYLDLLYSNSSSIDAQHKATLSFIKDIEKMKISFKNKKRLL